MVIVVKHSATQVGSLPAGAGIQRIVKYQGAFMLSVGLRLNIVNYIAGRFQLAPFPVCLLHQVEAVKGILFIVPEEAAHLKHTIWVCAANPARILSRRSGLALTHFSRNFDS